MLASSMLWFHTILYVHVCVCVFVCVCPPGRAWLVPCKTFVKCNWGCVFSPQRHSEQFFLRAGSKSGVRAFVWHLSITSGHWGIPHYSLLTMLQAHMCFPLWRWSKRTHHPACHYPAPSTTMSPFSRLFTHFQSGKEWAFDHEHDEMWLNLIYCGETILRDNPLSPPPGASQPWN